jgi:hypothetical protein
MRVIASFNDEIFSFIALRLLRECGSARPPLVRRQRAVELTHGRWRILQYSARRDGVQRVREQVEVDVYDSTDDNTAYLSLDITDVTTSTTLFNQTYDNTCVCFGVGSLTDEADFTLPYADLLQITETGYEFTRADVIYGSTVEDAEGWFYTPNPASFSTEVSITSPTPEPASIILTALGVVGFIFYRRRNLRRQ